MIESTLKIPLVQQREKCILVGCKSRVHAKSTRGGPQTSRRTTRELSTQHGIRGSPSPAAVYAAQKKGPHENRTQAVAWNPGLLGPRDSAQPGRHPNRMAKLLRVLSFHFANSPLLRRKPPSSIPSPDAVIFELSSPSP